MKRRALLLLPNQIEERAGFTRLVSARAMPATTLPNYNAHTQDSLKKLERYRESREKVRKRLRALAMETIIARITLRSLED